MYQTNKVFWIPLGLIDLAGYTLFFWKKLKKKPETISKALFIRTEHIGDMVMALPCFEKFKKSNHDTEVHVLCRSTTKSIAETCPYVDHAIEYNAPWFNMREGEKTTPIRLEKYDLVFEMHGDPRNIMLASKTKGYIVGYGCRGFGFMLNKKIRYRTDKHMIQQNLELIKDYSDGKDPKLQIWTHEKAKKECEEIMKKHKLKKKKYTIINPGSGRTEKNLSDSQVRKYIKEETSIILTGSKDEEENNQRFRQKNVIDLTGKTDILTLAELVKNAKKVIAPDTGIVHIAKAVGTECEAIYKTTDKNVWGY